MKFEVVSTYGAFGGLQYIGLTEKSTPILHYTRKQSKIFFLNYFVIPSSETSCNIGESIDIEYRQREHCNKMTYVVDDQTITTRGSGNCACCNSGASSKKSMI